MLSDLAWLEIDDSKDLASKQGFRRIVGDLRDAAPGPNFRAEVQFQFVSRYAASLCDLNRGNAAYTSVKLLEDREVNGV